MKVEKRNIILFNNIKLLQDIYLFFSTLMPNLKTSLFILTYYDKHINIKGTYK